MGLVDSIGAHLRMVRRRADLSQRDLAARSGVPLTTIARIEAEKTHDPRLSTLSRLVEAAGFRLAILDGDTELGPLRDGKALRDKAWRRFPAHLDLWRVRDYLDWWCSVHHKRHPPLPDYSYTWVRAYRDGYRENVGRAAADEGYGSNL